METLIICGTILFCIFFICIACYAINKDTNDLKIVTSEQINKQELIYEILNIINLKYQSEDNKKLIIKCLKILNEDYKEINEDID